MITKSRFALVGLLALSGFATANASGLTADATLNPALIRSNLTFSAADTVRVVPVHRRAYRHGHRYRSHGYRRHHSYRRGYRGYWRSPRYSYRYRSYYYPRYYRYTH